MAALTVVMALIGTLPMGGLILLFLPLPLIILTYEHGLRSAVLALAVAAILLGFLGHPSLALTVFLFDGLVGIVMGSAMQRGEPAWRLFGQALLAGAVGLCSMWLLSKLLFRQDVFVLTMQGFEAAITEAFKFYQGLPLAAEQLELVKQMQEAMLQLVELAIPSLILMSILLSLFVNFQASRKIIALQGGSVAGLPPFASWRLPWYLVWFFIAALLLGGAGESLFQKVNFNIYILMMFLYVLQGLAVAAHLVGRGSLSRFWQGIILALAFLFFSQILFFVGLFDTWFDFRKLDRAKRGE